MANGGLSLRQERALALTPKFTASISIPCSIFIIYEVYCEHRTRGTTAVQRAVLGMSIIDILASSAWFLSTWAVPEGSFAFAAGNMTTCNFQGFLLQLAIGAPLYNCSLALFYNLMIVRRWTDKQLEKIEWFVHGFILCFTVGTSILLLQLEQYNHIQAVCWVMGSPPGCGNSSYQPGDIPCERGNHAWAWGLFLFYGPLWFCVLACSSSMAMLYWHVRKTHRRSMRYSTAIGLDHSLNRSGSDSNRVATQAILYSFSFVITWMPSTMWSIAYWFNWGHYGLDIAAATAEPLQGFWNLLIFLKSRPKTVFRLRTLLSRLCPCFIRPPDDQDYRTSFATVLRSKSSAAGSLAMFSEDFASAPQRSPHRNTASTEGLEDVKAVRDSPCDQCSDKMYDTSGHTTTGSQHFAVATQEPGATNTCTTEPIHKNHRCSHVHVTFSMVADPGESDTAPSPEDASIQNAQNRDAKIDDETGGNELLEPQPHEVFRIDDLCDVDSDDEDEETKENEPVEPQHELNEVCRIDDAPDHCSDFEDEGGHSVVAAGGDRSAEVR